VDDLGSPTPCSLHTDQKVLINDADIIGTKTAESPTKDEDQNHIRVYIISKITYSVGDRHNTSGLIATVQAFRERTIS